MKRALFTEINDALKDRKEWADRQKTAYQMRNGGIRRSSKPYPGAPDGWYPLGDTMIEKLKAPYTQQMYGAETIASFVSLKQQESGLTAAVGQWFDYQLKQRSNFERTMFVAIDQMLEQAFCPVKVYWDAKCKCLAFDQVDPLHLIVPSTTQEYNQNGGADWLVHVLHMSVAEYRANPNFKQDEEFIERIRGEGKEKDTGEEKQDVVDLKEGINCSKDKNEIVLWEIYRRDRKMKRIRVETISPLLPCEDSENVVRGEFGLPYNKGVFAYGAFPFFKIRSEIKGKGHYSSRGVIEINAPFEASLTANWNTIHTWGHFFSNPTYSSTQPVPNAGAVKTKPGAIMPPGLTPNVPPPFPQHIREDMELTRAVAEDRTQIPNLGASEHLSGDKGAKGNVTAEQIRAIVGQTSQNNDMRARVFRLDFSEGLKLAWGITLQYMADATVNADATVSLMAYVANGQIQTLDPAALHDAYDIAPNGSADSWNKQAVVAKRAAYYQQFQNNPFIDQAELTKWFMEADDPGLVKRLFRDPNSQKADETEEQAIEITALMEKGFSAQVDPADDDKAHLICGGQYVERKMMKQEVITPETARLLLQHFGAHIQQLHQKKDPLVRQIEQQAKPIAQILQAIAQMDQVPPNVLKMQPGPMPVSPPVSASSQGAGPAAPISAQPQTV